MPSENEKIESFSKNLKKDSKEFSEKVRRYPLITLCFIIVVLFLIIIPYLQVDYQRVNNSTEKATLENQYRATLAQVLGGAAIGISLYYTWRRIAIAEEDLKTTQENLKVTQEIAKNTLKTSQEGQINERFTRAIDQLGNNKMEIRLGGIYALERISTESENYYWQIMEILTAYIRKNSSAKTFGNKKETHLSMDIQANESKNRENSEVSLDVQAILTVITKREFPHNNEEDKCLDLRMTYLEEAYLKGAYLKGANLEEANLEGANLEGANLEGANLEGANLEGANLAWASLKGADLKGADLKEANLQEAHLEGANLAWANLEEAHLEGANLRGAHLERAKITSLYPLSQVETLYNAVLDPDLEQLLRENCPAVFNERKYIYIY